MSREQRFRIMALTLLTGGYTVTAVLAARQQGVGGLVTCSAIWLPSAWATWGIIVEPWCRGKR